MVEDNDIELRYWWSGNLSGNFNPMGEPKNMITEPKKEKGIGLASIDAEDPQTFVPKEAIDNLRQKLEARRATRHNTGKPKLSYIHLDCFYEAAKVLEVGAEVYGKNNWRLGQDRDQLLDSMMRHIAKLQSGEELDSESGLSHIGHIQCNAMFLGLWLKNNKEK